MRVVTALRDLADELDECGLRPLGTSCLHEAREMQSMQLSAAQRLLAANNQGDKHVETTDGVAVSATAEG